MSIALRRYMQAAPHERHARVACRNERCLNGREENHLPAEVEIGSPQPGHGVCCEARHRRTHRAVAAVVEIAELVDEPLAGPRVAQPRSKAIDARCAVSAGGSSP